MRRPRALALVVPRRALAVLVLAFATLEAGCPAPPPPPSPAPSLRGLLMLAAGDTDTGFLDGTASEARFAGPTAQALSPDGRTLYLSDTFNSTVRALDTASLAVTTLAGRALDEAAIDGPLADARFASPRGLTAFGDRLYVSDGPSVRVIDLAGGVVSTLAGDALRSGDVDGDAESARFGFLLHDLVVDEPRGVLYAADRINNTIRAVVLADGTTTTIVDGAGGLDGPGGLALDPGSDTLYVADTFHDLIVAVDLTSGTASALATGVIEPQGIALVDDALYAAGFDGVIRKIALPGGGVSVVEIADETSPPLGGAFAPIVALTGGALAYVDLAQNAVRKIEIGTGSGIAAVSTLAGPIGARGFTDGDATTARLALPMSIAASSDGAKLWFTDLDNDAVRTLDIATGTVTTLKRTVAFATGIAVDEAGGDLYVAQSGDGDLLRMDLDGANESVLASGFTDVRELDIDVAAGSLYVADGTSGNVARVLLADGTRENIASLTTPHGVAVDGDTLWVSDVDAHVVLQLEIASGAVLQTLGTEGFPGSIDGDAFTALYSSPAGLSRRGRALYVTELAGQVVRVVDLDTLVSTFIAGTPERGGGMAPGIAQPLVGSSLLDPVDIVAVPGAGGDDIYVCGASALWVARP